MQYHSIVRGTFRSRPNRFIAMVEIDGTEYRCHVKNTGRCRELLVPGCMVLLEPGETPGRKTPYDLVAVYKGNLLINMDSQAPNKAVQEWLAAGGLFRDYEPVSLPDCFGSRLVTLKPEQTYGASRFDFYVETDGCRLFLEVKGVTLEEDGVLRFPDAPTERGVKHLEELIACRKEGYEAAVLFVIQMERAKYFTPNTVTHPEFAEALLRAQEAGVHVMAMNCRVRENGMELDRTVPVRL